MAVKQWFGRFVVKSDKSAQPKSQRRAHLACEVFEERVVLSHMGGMPGGGFQRGHRNGLPAQVGSLSPKTPPFNIFNALATIGITPVGKGLGLGRDDDHVPPTTGTDTTVNTLFANLKTAMDQLRKDTQAIAANSGLTVADIMALTNDSQTIAATGASIDSSKLEAAVNSLAYAVAGGTDQTQAKADFAAVFSGTAVPQATIDKTTADLVQAITDSKVTTTNLDTLKTDKANLDAAQKALSESGYGPGSGKGDCKTATTTTSSTSSTSSTSTSGVTVASATGLKSATRGMLRVRRAVRHR